ncbi:MAG: MBL fold metallo-hydrolase [Bacteroidetes bacterium]|nr:MBL fold metallo-hydrolase [Bacteroidota bacterium]
MIKIERFIFNLFEVNTYVLYDETKESVIIDPGCYESAEQNRLKKFIEEKGLKPVRLLNTHTHIDHILGNQFIVNQYNIKLEIHEKGLIFLNKLPVTAVGFGMIVDEVPQPGNFIKNGDIIKFGNSRLKVLYTPGHADGSVCFYNEEQKFVIVGDVLFNQSIGRTDLPTGDFDLLNKSIEEELFTLPDDVIVYPGHGPETTIGFEKINNPYVDLV